MKIVIAGAGKVGFNLARYLSNDHDVSIIDQNESALARIQEELDILSIVGDIRDPSTYAKLPNNEIDTFIAVSNKDEANLISLIIIDDIIKVDKKIIRLKNEFFSKDSIQDKLGIQSSIFPMAILAQSIQNVLNFTLINSVKNFSSTDMKLIGLKVCNIANDMIISEIHEEFENTFIVGYERDEEFHISKDDDHILEDDLVYVFGPYDQLIKMIKKCHQKEQIPIKRCVIYGANNAAIAIAKVILQNNINVKLIDKDAKDCQNASKQLDNNATVINNIYGTERLLKDSFENTDLFISATRNDEFNIIKAIEATKHKVPKVMATLNSDEYHEIAHDIGISTIRGSKTNTFFSILENMHSSNIITKRIFCSTKAVLYMRNNFDDSPLIGQEIKPLKMSNVRTIILRQDTIFPITEPITIEAGDIVVAFSNTEDGEAIRSWINFK